MGLATDKTYKCCLGLLSVVKTVVARAPRKSCGMYDHYQAELNPLWSLSPDFDDQNLEVKAAGLGGDRHWWLNFTVKQGVGC